MFTPNGTERAHVNWQDSSSPDMLLKHRCPFHTRVLFWPVRGVRSLVCPEKNLLPALVILFSQVAKPSLWRQCLPVAPGPEKPDVIPEAISSGV